MTIFKAPCSQCGDRGYIIIEDPSVTGEIKEQFCGACKIGGLMAQIAIQEGMIDGYDKDLKLAKEKIEALNRIIDNYENDRES